MDRIFFSLAARPHLAGKSIQVSFLAGTDPDPTKGDMKPMGELWMEPHEWRAMRRLLTPGANDARVGVGLEILDGTDRPGDKNNIVEFTRNWKG